MSADDYPVSEHDLSHAAVCLHALSYHGEANTVESALIEVLALRARVAELEKGSDFAADALRVVERRRDELKAERNDFRAKLGAITVWLEANQPDVFRRGLWDAIRCASNKEGSRE